MAIEALTYCIQHNDMFSVQYDVEKPAKSPQQRQQEQHSTASSPAPNPSGSNPEASNNGYQPEAAKETAAEEGKFITKTISNKSLNKSEDQIFVNITRLEEAIQNRHNPPSQPTEPSKAEPN